MAHAEICPVCKGNGKVEKETCHGCGGKGWVQVDDVGNTFFPIYPCQPCNPYQPPYNYYYGQFHWSSAGSSGTCHLGLDGSCKTVGI